MRRTPTIMHCSFNMGVASREACKHWPHIRGRAQLIMLPVTHFPGCALRPLVRTQTLVKFGISKTPNKLLLTMMYVIHLPRRLVTTFRNLASVFLPARFFATGLSTRLCVLEQR